MTDVQRMLNQEMTKNLLSPRPGDRGHIATLNLIQNQSRNLIIYFIFIDKYFISIFHFHNTFSLKRLIFFLLILIIFYVYLQFMLEFTLEIFMK